MTLPSTPSATARFSMIVNALVTTVVRWNCVLGLLGFAICNHICRIGHRFQALVEQVRAGKVPPERRRARTGSAAADRAKRPLPVSGGLRLPRRFRWLVALIPDAINNGSQLVHLLEDPEMVALVAASPGLRRLLRSMCRMLGVSDLPALIRLPPRVRRARVPRDPVAETSSRRLGFSPPSQRKEDGGLKPTPRSASSAWLGGSSSPRGRFSSA